MTSPTQRSLALLRDEGWTVEVVEHWNPHARIRQDLFGFADLIAMKPGFAPLLVQVTSTGWVSRIAKIAKEPRAAIARASGFRIEIHGWRKLKSNRGKWTPIRLPVLTPDLPKPSDVHQGPALHRPPDGTEPAGAAGSL